MQEERPPEIGPGGRSRCEFGCEFLATTQRFQLPRYDSDCPEHRVSTTISSYVGTLGRRFGTRRSVVQILSHRLVVARSIPDTWVTVYSEHIGNTLEPKG